MPASSTAPTSHHAVAEPVALSAAFSQSSSMRRVSPTHPVQRSTLHADQAFHPGQADHRHALGIAPICETFGDPVRTRVPPLVISMISSSSP